MKYCSSPHRAPLKALLLLSCLSFAYPAYSQVSDINWGEINALSQANSDDRVDYFLENLRPHASSRYENRQYRKTIVKLNWFDEERSHSAYVNLNRTFDIYGLFDGASLVLSDRATAILDDLGEAILSEGINTRMYTIAGHSSKTGDPKNDQELSTQRAKIVQDYLKQKFDISEKRLRPVGFGSYNPKDKKNLKSAKNNRIELCLIEDLYQHKAETTIQLPDSNASSNEGILITTAGKTPSKNKKLAANTPKPRPKKLLKYQRRVQQEAQIRYKKTSSHKAPLKHTKMKAVPNKRRPVSNDAPALHDEKGRPGSNFRPQMAQKRYDERRYAQPYKDHQTHNPDYRDHSRGYSYGSYREDFSGDNINDGYDEVYAPGNPYEAYAAEDRNERGYGGSYSGNIRCQP